MATESKWERRKRIREEKGVTNVTQESAKQTLEDFEASTSDIADYVSSNSYSSKDDGQKYLDELKKKREELDLVSDYYTRYGADKETIFSLSNYYKYLNSLEKGANNKKNYFSQWETEADHKNYLDQVKEQERLEYLNVKEARDKKYALEQELALVNSKAQAQRKATGTVATVSAGIRNKTNSADAFIDSSTIDRRNALQQEIDALGRDINLASRIQTNKYLTDRAVNAEDFGEFSFDPLIEEKVINPHQQNIERDNSAERFMTEDEKAIYNYYFNKVGEAKAEEYLDSIQEDLNFRQAKAIFEGNEDNVLAQLALMAPTQGLEQSKSGFQGALRMVMGNDSYQPVSTYDYLGQMAKEDLADKGFKLPEWMGGQSIGQLAYDLVNTGANMAPSIAVGALTGTGPLAFGASAAGNAYTQKINEGYSKEQATAYGVIIGVSEATLEKVVGAIGFGGKTLASKAVAKLLPKIDNAAARIAVKYGSSMLSEGIEEGLQEVLEPLYRNAAFGENNELEITEDAIYSALLGALSGGLMEGTPYAISEGINASYQNKINEKYGKSVGEIVNEGLSAPQDSEAYKLAKEAKAKLNAGEELSDEELDVLAKVSAEVPQERKQAVTEASEAKPIVLQSKEIPNPGRRTVGISEKQIETFASKLPNATEDTGKQVAAMYDIKDGVSKETFIKGVDEAYRYGSMNFSLEEMDRGGSFAKDIPSEKKLQAYYMGQRNAETATITKANEQQKKALSGVKGKVVFEGNAATQIKNNQQRSTIRFINSVLKNASSMEYHIFASYEEDGKRVYKNSEGKVVPAPNGFYDPKNHQIWIDVNAGAKGQGIMLYTLTHEHVHDIKVWSAEHYNELVKITSQAFEHAGKSFKEAVDVKYAQYKKNHPDTTYEDAQEEVVAEAMSGLLSDEKALREFSEQIQKKDASLWNRIKAWFNDVIARITAAYKGVEPESEEAKLLMEQRELFEHAQKVFAEAVVTAGQNYKNAGVESSTSQVKNADTNAKFQARNSDESQQNQEKERPKISIGMTDSERTKILRYKKIVAPVYKGQADDAINANISNLESHQLSTIKSVITKIGEEFGVYIDYNIKDIDMKISLSKNNLKESMQKDATPTQIAKLLPILKSVVENSVGIEQHANRYYHDSATLYFEELLGGYIDGENFIPVRFGIRHSKSSNPVLYVVVDQNGIETKKIKAEVKNKVSPSQEGAAVPRSAFKYSLSQIIHSVNSKDLLRYLPDNMLNSEQKNLKWEGIAETIEKTKNKNDENYFKFVQAGNNGALKNMVRAAAKAHGYEIHAFHGTSRGDRVGNVFLPERATSGPMAFFTDDRATAEGYATGKRDTSIAYDPDFDSYETQFRVKVSGMDIPFHRAWGYLPFDARNRVAKKAGQLREDWDGDGELILDPETNEANGGFQWQLKEARGNVIKALIDQWLNSGNLFNEEAKFLDVIEMSGLKEEFAKIGINTIYFKDPNARHEKVYDVYLKISKPFDTATVDEQFISGFIDWYEEQDESKYQRENMESDLWDKNGVDAYEFAERLKRDIENDTTHAWTSIPDFVTDYLKHLGYDGIKDLGGKFHETTHTVWIPFYSNQVKSAEPITYDENDNAIPISKRFDEEKVDIRYSLRGTKSQDRDSEYMEAVKKADIGTMQKLVEEAAKDAGYTEKLYHGTNRFGFTVPRTEGLEAGVEWSPFFATDSEEVAQTYSGISGTRWIADDSLSEESIDKAYEEADKNVNDCVDDLFWTVERQLPYTVDFSDLSNYAEELADGLYMNKISDSEVDENLYDYIAERVHHSWTYARDNYGEYEDYDGYLDWVESEDAEKIWEATDKLTQAILNYVKARNMTGLEDVGNYGLYANPDNLFEIDAKGAYWNQIPFEQYDSNRKKINTRNLAAYARDNGYKGVKITNVYDDGGRGKYQTKPATVYIFFNPQEQVKSADPVTYDDNGNVIPLSERFKKENNDIRYQDRLSNADKNRVEILENKNARLEKELADLEKAYESVQNYARAEGILIGQVEQGRTMAKEMRQKQATFDRKAKGYENAIAKKKEQISAVRQQKNELLAKAKAERAEAVERVRKADRERMEKAIADIKATERAKFNAAKERSDEQKRAIIEKYQTSIKKATEGRHRTDIRGKIKRVVNELNTLLTKQTKERHIPLELQKPVADALDILNLDDQRYYESRIRGLEARIAEAKSSEERNLLQEELNKIIDHRTAFEDKIAGLKKAYKSIKDSADPYIAVGYNENIAKMIDRVAEDIGDTLLRDMSMTQLQEVYDLYKGILKTVRDANKFFNEEKGASVVEAGRNVVSEIEASGKTIDQISKKKLEREKFYWNNLKPVYAFKKLGSKTLENLFGGILKGQGTWAKDVSEAKDFFERTGNKYGYKKWDKKKTFEFTSNTGKKFSLNLQQMMSLYAYSKRDQAFKHLTDGGFVFDNKETIRKNGKEYVVNTAQAYNISAATLQQIIGKLSTDQRMFVDEMQKYLSETMGAKGNEVSRAMYDIELFGEKIYFPLKSADQFKADRNEVTNETKKLVNSGFTKPIQPGANNPIILTGFMDVWANHVNDMSMYHAFVMPIENFNKVYNFQFGRSEDSDSKSVKSAIQDSFTEAANQYIEQLLKDINGGARVDSRESNYKRLVGNWKKAAVFASASVVVQQPSAIGRAFAEINPVYFMAPTEIGVLKHKKQWEQLKKYAPVAVIKEMGYFDTDMGQSTAEFIKGEKTLKDKADDIFGWAPAKADEYTWCAIWDAVKRETKAKHKDLNVNSEEFLKIAGERFTEVIDKTQVYDSVLSRSGNMRSKSIFMQMLTAFMAEPTTSANMVEQAFREAKAGHPKKAMAYVNSVGASVIINSLLVSFVYALRDDDEDERFHDKYLEALLKELADGFNPLTYIPLAKDVWSIFQGWDVERVDMSLFKDLYDNLEKEVKTVKELVEGIIDGSLSEEEIKAGFKEAGEYMFPVLDTIASMNGVPLKNLRRDFYTMPKNTFKIFNQNQKELSYSEKYLWDILHEAFLDQTPFGHIFFESKDEKLFNAFDSEDKVYIGRLEKIYSSEDAYSNAAKAVIKKGVIGGEFSESQAKTYLVDYIGLKSDDAEGYIHSWKFEEKWGFAWSDRAEAFANGQIKEDKLKQAVMEYKEFTAEETDKAEKEVEKIKFKAENGFDYSARRNEYIEGNITKEQLKKALKDVDGKTSEEADMQIKLYDLQKAGFEEVTEYAVKDYYEFCEPAGISEEVYFKFFEDTKDIKGDYDSKGESIPYSKTKKIMPYIAKLPLTAKQKTAVAKSFGWADKTIAKYRLW